MLGAKETIVCSAQPYGILSKLPILDMAGPITSPTTFTYALSEPAINSDLFGSGSSYVSSADPLEAP